MEFPDGIPPLNERPIKNTICLFDVDGTLTPARRAVSPSMLSLLHTLRQKTSIGFVGGSDLIKQQEQLCPPSRTSPSPPSVTSLFDYSFAQNGLTAYKLSSALESTSFISWLGEDKYKKLVNFCLRYIADLDVPVKRGTFVEFRAGMVNVSPVGRNASTVERGEFEAWDKQSRCREKFIEALRGEFGDLGLTYSIGGQISFDVFPTGWDKTYCLRHLENEAKLPGGVEYTTIHFFGDKTYKGGNDYEIYHDPRVIGHAVTDPEDTEKQVRALFSL